MSYTDYIIVTDYDNDDKVEIPVEHDDTVLLPTLQSQFPHAIGLRYRNPVTGIYRAIRCVDDILFPPEEGWADFAYTVHYFSKEQPNKRKMDDVESSSSSKTQRLNFSPAPCDLIVLNLPYSLSSEELREFFEELNVELSFCEECRALIGTENFILLQIKMDTKLKQSRGFGFIRCCNYEDQKQLVGKKFVLHEREIRIQKPHSKDNEPTRLFVGRLSNQIKKSDLREYFEQFGEVVDVYYPEHNRGFGFVTLADSAVATAVLRMSHVLKNVNLVVNVAESKQTKQHEVLTFRPTLLKPDSKDRLHLDEQLEDRYPPSPTMLDTLERRLDSRSSPPYSTDKRFSDSSDPNYSFSPDMFNAMAHMMTSVAKAVQGGSKSDYWNPVRERSRPTSRHRDWGSGSGMRF